LALCVSIFLVAFVLYVHWRHYRAQMHKLEQIAKLEPGITSIPKQVTSNAYRIIDALNHPLFHIADWKILPTNNGTLLLMRGDEKSIGGHNEVEIYPNKLVFCHAGHVSFRITFDSVDAVANTMRAYQYGYWRQVRFWFPKNVNKK